MIKSKKEMKKVVLHFALKYKGNWEKIYDAIKAREDVTIEQVEALMDKYNDNFMSIIDEDYLENFKSIYMPPLTLFHTGNCSLLQDEQNIISLWGDLSPDNWDAANLDKSKTYAIIYNPVMQYDVQLLLEKGYKLILITNTYKNSEISFVKDYDNALFVTEIPFEVKNPDIDVEQTNERILLGISQVSMMLGDKQLNTFEFIEPLFRFEKRPINVMDLSIFSETEIRRFNIKQYSNVAN